MSTILLQVVEHYKVVYYKMHHFVKSMLCCSLYSGTLIMWCLFMSNTHTFDYQFKIYMHKLETENKISWKVCTVGSRKRAHGRCTLLCTQTRGWADICNIAAFYHEIAHYHNNKKTVLHTNTPAQYCWQPWSSGLLVATRRSSALHRIRIRRSNEPPKCA